jgi:transcriptional regulator with XRE-family HTH domain
MVKFKIKTLTKSFDNPIAVWRSSKNLSKKAIADAVGTTEQVVESWEKNESSPRDKYLHRLAAIMETSPETLREQLPKKTKVSSMIQNNQNPGQKI